MIENDESVLFLNLFSQDETGCDAKSMQVFVKWI